MQNSYVGAPSQLAPAMDSSYDSFWQSSLIKQKLRSTSFL